MDLKIGDRVKVLVGHYVGMQGIVRRVYRELAPQSVGVRIDDTDGAEPLTWGVKPLAWLKPDEIEKVG